MLVVENYPISFEEAIMSKHWIEVMAKEMEVIERNHTWELIVLPHGVTPIGVKWVIKTKLNVDEKVEKQKAKLVTKGYAQRHGIDYTEVFAPVAKLDTIRLILPTTAQFSWMVFQRRYICPTT